MPPILDRGMVIRSVNEETRRAHRRQTFWQIFFPLILAILLAVTLFALVLSGGKNSIDRGAQTATILMTIPIMAAGLIFLFLAIIASFALGRLMKWLPPHSYQAHKVAQKINSRIAQVSEASKQPFLLIESWADALARMLQRIR